jgi:hypothetical protein
MLIAPRPGVNFADAKLTPCGRNNSVVMVAHTVPGALLIPEPTDTGLRPWG